MTEPFRANPLPLGTARLWNALACRLLPAAVTLDNGQSSPPSVGVTCPVAGGNDEAEPAFTLYVNLNGLWRVQFGNLDLLALRPELNDWLQADVANRFGMLPEGLIRAVLERLFLPVLDTISRHTGMPAIFVGSPRTSVRPMFTEHLDMLLNVTGEQPLACPVRIAWQDRATLVPVVERLEALPLRRLQLPAVADANLDACLVIGGMRLTPKELASLNSGDVLLPPSLTPKEPRLHLADGLTLACALNGDTLTLRAMETPAARTAHGEQNMSETVTENTVSPEAASEQPAAPLLEQGDLEKLELNITFELPGLRLPLAECARLAPGYTFTLSADAANLPVTVRAGGRAVALGRLVDVGGTVGVQLTQLAGTPAEVDSSAKEGD